MLSERAYAKVNLGLQVCNKRLDGFHNLESVFLLVDLYDELIFTKTKSSAIEIKMDGLKTEDNIIYKTIILVRNHFDIKKGLKVIVKKNIPLGAGLGGGSSNAAATLRALDQLWDLKMTKEQYYYFASQLGSDVFFFIDSIHALVRGRGEFVEKLDFIIDLNFVLIYPNYNIKTKDVFASFNSFYCDKRILNLVNVLKTNNIDKIALALFNDLTKASAIVSTKLGMPSASEIINELSNLDIKRTIMTGSGSSVIVLVNNKNEGYALTKKLKLKFPNYKIWPLSTKLL